MRRTVPLSVHSRVVEIDSDEDVSQWIINGQPYFVDDDVLVFPGMMRAFVIKSNVAYVMTFEEKVDLIDKGIDWVAWNKQQALSTLLDSPPSMETCQKQMILLHHQAMNLRSECGTDPDRRAVLAKIMERVLLLFDVAVDAKPA